MAIKRFTAETWEDALRQLRAEFGEDPVILHSKTYKDGGILGVGQRTVVEITATDDKEVAAKHQKAANAGEAAGDSEKQDYSKLLEKAYAIAAARADGSEADPFKPGMGLGAQSSLDDSSSSSGALRPARDEDSEIRRVKDSLRASLSKANTADDSRSSGLIAPAGAKPGKDADKQRIESLMHDVSELKELVARLVTTGDAKGLADANPTLKQAYDRLIQNDISQDRAKEIIAEVNRALSGPELDSLDAVLGATRDVIAGMVPLAGPLQLGNNKTSVVALIGPTGVGKTTTLSKLAANLLIKDRYRVGFITIDTYRLGATEQLRTLANVLDVPMRVVMSPSEMRTTIREMESLEVIFVDTAGRSHRDRMKMNELKTFLDAAAPDETHLCLSATTHPSHMFSVLDHFGSLAVDKVILTKLDEAATYGPVLDVITATGKPLSYLTTGQDIPDDIELADAQRVARLVMGEMVLQS